MASFASGILSCTEKLMVDSVTARCPGPVAAKQLGIITAMLDREVPLLKRCVQFWSWAFRANDSIWCLLFMRHYSRSLVSIEHCTLSFFFSNCLSGIIAYVFALYQHTPEWVEEKYTLLFNWQKHMTETGCTNFCTRLYSDLALWCHRTWWLEQLTKRHLFRLQQPQTERCNCLFFFLSESLQTIKNVSLRELFHIIPPLNNLQVHWVSYLKNNLEPFVTWFGLLISSSSK